MKKILCAWLILLLSIGAAMADTRVLLVGLDRRPGEKTGRSDTMILVSVDEGEIRMVSFMRDLYVRIPEHKNDRLNAAWVYGGEPLLRATLKENFGVTYDRYVAVDFSCLAEAIDDLGGLEIDIDTEKQRKAVNGVIKEDNRTLGIAADADLITETGTQLLNGRQAQAYARYRKNESDFTRTARQRQVVEKMAEKARELSRLKRAQLTWKYIRKAETDLKLSDAVKLYGCLSGGMTVSETRIPRDGHYANATISGKAVLTYDEADARSALKAFLEE